MPRQLTNVEKEGKITSQSKAISISVKSEQLLNVRIGSAALVQSGLSKCMEEPI